MPCDEKDRLLDELSTATRQWNLSVMESHYLTGTAHSLARQERIGQLERAVAQARAAFDRHVTEHGCGAGPGTRF